MGGKSKGQLASESQSGPGDGTGEEGGGLNGSKGGPRRDASEGGRGNEG